MTSPHASSGIASLRIAARHIEHAFSALSGTRSSVHDFSMDAVEATGSMREELEEIKSIVSKEADHMARDFASLNQLLKRIHQENAAAKDGSTKRLAIVALRHTKTHRQVVSAFHREVLKLKEAHRATKRDVGLQMQDGANLFNQLSSVLREVTAAKEMEARCHREQARKLGLLQQAARVLHQSNCELRDEECEARHRIEILGERVHILEQQNAWLASETPDREAEIRGRKKPRREEFNQPPSVLYSYQPNAVYSSAPPLNPMWNGNIGG
jgi:hypothetical protein